MKLLILFTLISFATLSQESMKFTADKKLHFLAGAGVGYVVSDIAYKSDRFNNRERLYWACLLLMSLVQERKCTTFIQRMARHHFKTFHILFTVALLVRSQALELTSGLTTERKNEN